MSVREEGRISPAQFAVLLISYLIGRSTLIMPVEVAKQDAWLAILAGGFLAVGPMLLWLALGLRFPGQSPVRYVRSVLGNFLGLPLLLLYLWFFLHVGAGVTRNIGEMYVIAIMPETPIVVFVGTMSFLASLTVRGGVEVIARLAELLLPWLIISIVGLAVLSLATPGLTHWEYLEPVFGSGWRNILRGILLSFAFPFAEEIPFFFFLPLLLEARKVKRYALGSLGFVALLLALVQARNIVILGPNEIVRLNFPTLAAVQLINLGEFLQRLDALAVFNWTFGTFFKIVVLHYAVCLGSAELLGLQDYRPLVFPVGIIMTSLAMVIYENFAQMKEFYSTIYPFYALPFFLLGPALVLTVAVLRKQSAKGRGEQKAKK